MVLRVGQSGDTGNAWCLVVWVSLVTQVMVPRVGQSGDTGNGWCLVWVSLVTQVMDGALCGSVW